MSHSEIYSPCPVQFKSLSKFSVPVPNSDPAMKILITDLRMTRIQITYFLLKKDQGYFLKDHSLFLVEGIFCTL